MNRNLVGMTNEFVDQRVRMVLRIVFGFVAALVLIGMIFNGPVVPVDHGTGDESQKATASTKVLSAERPQEVNETLHQKRSEVAKEKPEKQKANEQPSSFVEVEQPEAAVDEPNIEPTEHTSPEPTPPAVAQAAKTSPVSEPEIIAGATAPRYVLADPDQCFDLAKRFGCRFVVTGRSLSVNAGRVLNGGQLRAIDSTWHDQYAKRMIRVPNSTAAQKTIAAAQQRYNLESPKCYLSVPHELDRAIYEAQREFLGKDWDVSVTTVVDFYGRSPTVRKVLDATNQMNEGSN